MSHFEGRFEPPGSGSVIFVRILIRIWLGITKKLRKNLFFVGIFFHAFSCRKNFQFLKKILFFEGGFALLMEDNDSLPSGEEDKSEEEQQDKEVKVVPKKDKKKKKSPKPEAEPMEDEEEAKEEKGTVRLRYF
jgi:hypothetical protein